MKITRRQLRRIILEQLTSSELQRPSHHEEVVMDRLKKMMVPGEGLPVTHEFSARSLDEVLEEEAILGTYGIFFSLGHLESPQFAIGPGYMVHGYIRPADVDSRRGAMIRPDMRFSVDADDEEYDDEWEALLAAADEERTGFRQGELAGLEISTSDYDEWPSSNWEKIVDNQTGEVIWPEVNL